jgi:hypothetical protein
MGITGHPAAHVSFIHRNIWRVLFADVFTAVGSYTQSEGSSAEYGGETERNVPVPQE